MFAPKLVKPQTKAAENSTNSLACRRSTFVARQPCNDRSGEQKETGLALDAHVAPGLSWSFGKILSFPPGQVTPKLGLRSLRRQLYSLSERPTIRSSTKPTA